MSKSIKKQNKPTKRARQQRAPRLISNRLYADTFPRSMKVTLSYYEQFTISSLVPGVTPDFRFRLNSIFDPDLSGVGHQPLGYDQYALMYHQYRVDYCTAEVTWGHITATEGANCVIFASNDSNPLTDNSVANESPLTKTGCFSGGAKPLKLVKRYDLAEVNGITKAEYVSDDIHHSKMSTSPVETCTLHVMTTTLMNACEVAFTVKLKFEVTLTDVIVTTRSLLSNTMDSPGVSITNPPPSHSPPSSHLTVRARDVRR